MDELDKRATDELNRLLGNYMPRQPKYRYLETPRKRGFVIHRYVWTIEKNAVGKYQSGVYVFNAKGNRAMLKKLLMHSRKKIARKRAYRLYSRRIKIMENKNREGKNEV